MVLDSMCSYILTRAPDKRNSLINVFFFFFFLFFFLFFFFFVLFFLISQWKYTVNSRYNDIICNQDVAIKINLLLYRILNEQIDM